MLDQNTDRMWYVIGAVLVGAAIILIANGTLPQMFASVTSSFESVASKASEGVDSIKYGENLIYEYVIRNHNSDWATINTSQYGRTGKISIDSIGTYGGIYLKMDELELKPNTQYRMAYNFRKIDGTLVHIGGHTDGAFKNNYYYINGSRMSHTYHYATIGNMNTPEVKDTKDIQTVEVFFTTPDDLENVSNGYDGRISIQPNRYMNIPVKVEISNLSLSEVL